jgi:hypothetical protein
VALSDNTHGWSKTFINEEEERLLAVLESKNDETDRLIRVQHRFWLRFAQVDPEYESEINSQSSQ